eukprot:m.11130 g.11130  ORF g.11130 m.11130 type:complete len:1020 (+) comp2818_c0_seq1:31-3090(+)
MKALADDPSGYLDVGGPDNLASLENLTEESIVQAIKGRYDVDNIHSYIGDILLIVNPHKRLGLYTDEIRGWYSGGQYPRDKIAPHAYKVADIAYENMCNQRRKQTLVISGESGAGKTETAKIMVSQIIYLCRAGRTNLERKIQNLNPFLEAFGNAKTSLNHNSSRFGKYLELVFDEGGSICGASMAHYLLEKARVTVRNEGENIFHVFYQLISSLAASDVLADYHLSKPSKHAYLHNPPGPADDDVLQGTLKTCGDGLRSEWEETVSSLSNIGVTGDALESLKRILAGIIVTGDISFTSGKHDSSHITNKDVTERVARLLGTNFDDLCRALTITTAMARGEKVTRNLTTVHAAATRDAMARMIYYRIFTQLFELCNEILVDPSASERNTCTIGILDIFGFEVFKDNSLEQMCIDVANEQLQGYFNHTIFVAEQEEYKKEGISLDKIEFENNEPTLDLFFKMGGIFSILDDETRFPQATDLTFTHKCVSNLKAHPSQSFHPPKSDRDQSFEITHYAGKVTYTTTNFLEMNRDKLSDDISDVLMSSSDEFLANLFDPDRPMNQKGSGKKIPTLVSIFTESLKDLMENMGKCQPHFVRCIKPNTKQKALDWDEELVTRQLRYSGVLETVRIRKLGYSFRMHFGDFVKQYNNIVYHYHEDPPQSQETVVKILEFLKKATAGQAQNFDDTQVGKSKVFMKYYHSDMLNTIAKEHALAITYLQKISRGHMARQTYLELRTAARRQKRVVWDMFQAAEEMGEKVAANARRLAVQDETLTEDRAGWLEKVKMEAQMAEANKLEQESKAKEALLRVSDEPLYTRTKPINGYFIWQRNEHLTLKKGPLEKPWRKKKDEATGRFYFKNTETRTTTWVDPRSFDFDERPHNPSLCVGDQLPFGWDKAETESGTVFYIDHVTNTHHRLHPREDVAMKIQQRNALEAEAKAEIEEKVNLIVDLKKKLTLLTAQGAQAVDRYTVESIETRKRLIQQTIDKASAAVEKIRQKIESLSSMIRKMRENKSRDVLTRK